MKRGGADDVTARVRDLVAACQQGADDRTIEGAIAHVRAVHAPARHVAIEAVDDIGRALALASRRERSYIEGSMCEAERVAFQDECDDMRLSDREEERLFNRRFRPSAIAWQAFFWAYHWHPRHHDWSHGAIGAANLLSRTLGSWLAQPSALRLESTVFAPGGHGARLKASLVNGGLSAEHAEFLLRYGGLSGERMNIQAGRVAGAPWSPFNTDEHHRIVRAALVARGVPSEGGAAKKHAFTWPAWTHVDEDSEDATFWQAYRMTRCITLLGMRDEAQIARVSGANLRRVRRAFQRLRSEGVEAKVGTASEETWCSHLRNGRAFDERYSRRRMRELMARWEAGEAVEA